MMGHKHRRWLNIGTGLLALLTLLFRPPIVESSDVSLPDRREIRVCETNPAYWEYGGRPVLLLGGSIDDNLFQIQVLLLRQYIPLP